MGRVKQYYHREIMGESTRNGGSRSIDVQENQLYDRLSDQINLLAQEAARLDLLELDNHQY